MRVIPKPGWNTGGWLCINYSFESNLQFDFADPRDGAEGLSTKSFADYSAACGRIAFPWGVDENVFGILGRGRLGDIRACGLILRDNDQSLPPRLPGRIQNVEDSRSHRPLDPRK